ncbi:MAG: TA system VapC family ribonuclease toxin [Acidimicrobiales bacterium]
MSATVDAGVLLHATDESSRFHAPALRLLGDLMAGHGPLVLFWPVVFAYIRIATHPGVFDQPLSKDHARTNMEALLDHPNVEAIGEDDSFWGAYRAAAGQVFVRGDYVAHGYLAALMRQHRVPVIWSHDRAYRRFPGITVKDPFSARTGGVLRSR